MYLISGLIQYMNNAIYKEHCEHCASFRQLLWEESSYVLEVLDWNQSITVTGSQTLYSPYNKQRKMKSICPIFMDLFMDFAQKPSLKNIKEATQECKIENVLGDGEAAAECIIQKDTNWKNTGIRKGMCLAS